MISPGDFLRNRYRIEHSIGRGGMGEVFSAVIMLPAVGKGWDDEATLLRPSEESKRVAIKVVSRTVITEASMARLQREAVAASRIKSAFIPELVEVSTTNEGELFLAMEILYGETLAARLKVRRSLSWPEAFLLGDDILSGLIDAHEAGVIHRDLKPSNIFLCARRLPDMLERSKILDFGVCKLDAPDDDKLTGTGESVGTASYMAPEQIRGASFVTERADLYSFATVMFEAVSGHLPHTGAGQMAMLASKLERTALRLAEVPHETVPVGLEPLLAKLLSRDATKRHATARDVRDAWRALGPAVVVSEPQVTGAPVENTRLPPETGLASGVLDMASRGPSRIGLVLVAFSVTVSFVVVLVLVASRGRTKAPAADFAAVAEPVVSARVVERPAEPAPVEPVAQDEPALGDAALLVLPEARPAPSAPKPAFAPPPHPWRKPPGAGTTTKPHIADKPRY